MSAHGRSGFAIPVAVLVIVVVSMLALGGLYVTLSNLAADAGIHRSWKALYAADAGATYVVANWDRTAYGALGPGDSLDTGWRPLPGGASYRTILLRVDDGAAGSSATYRLRTIGRPAQVATAQRVILTMARATLPGAICCRAAVRLQGNLQLVGAGPPGSGPPKVDGTDVPPAIWGAQCPAPGPDEAGVSIQDEDDVLYIGSGHAEGSPPIEEDTSINDATFSDLGDLTYAELAAMADKTFLGNQNFAGTIFPQTSGGECLTASPTNWGDPLNPASPCFPYLPIVYVAGNLTISGGGYGQGILLVDGDLSVSGTFEYYGVVVVRGKAIWGGSARLIGGTLVRNRLGGTQTSQVRESAQVEYSSCAVSRALAKLAVVEPLAGRHWFEVLQ